MTTRHTSITDPNIHEPKGVASASDNQVYRANGSGSGTWEAPLTLIETKEIVSSTSTIEFNGLDNYSSLYLVIEGVEFSSSAATNYMRMQVGSPYRTSNYLNQVLGDGVDETDGISTGFIIGRHNSGVLDCNFGAVEILNFNVSSAPTVVRGATFATNNNPIDSFPSSGIPYHFFGMYTTNETHEDLRLDSTAGYTFESGSTLTLYGIS